MNVNQHELNDLVNQFQIKVDKHTGELKAARAGLRKAQRELDKEILADPHSWVIDNPNA